MGEPEVEIQLLTLAAAIAGGGLLMVIARVSRIPAIVLLLCGGVLLGPEYWGFVQPGSLGEIFQSIVGLAVALILFEGGLTLDLKGYRAVGSTIGRLLTIGALITWFSTAALIWLFYRFPFPLCMLAGSLVIVTGPTVIQPILKRIRLKWSLHNILHWEGVMIDPIGVFLAVMTFEWAIGGTGQEAVANFGLRFLVGAGIGVLGGELVYRLLRWVPEEMLNVFTIACAVLIYALAEHTIAESGLLSSTLAGLVVGAHQPKSLKVIREFKGILTDLLIGMLFILLAARLEIAQFIEFGKHGAWLIAAFLLVVRPLVIAACTHKAGFSVRDRIFLSWVAPRGVVAASMASLFSIALESRMENARFLETFTYSVIVSTVVLQGFSAAPLARILRLQEKHPTGWLIIGAHPLGRAVADFLRKVAKLHVAIVDVNRTAIADAQKEGFAAFQADAREVDAIERRPEMSGVGQVIAFTDNEDLNELLCSRWAESMGKDNVYRWSSGKSGLLHRGKREGGRSVWTWMPKPGIVSSELLLGDAHMRLYNSVPAHTSGHLVPVAALIGSKLMLDPNTSLKKLKGSEMQVLCLERVYDPLMNAIRPELLLRVDVLSRDELFRKLAKAVCDVEPGLDSKELFRAIGEREEQMPSNLGHGVAMPHARLPGLKSMVCAIANLVHPLAWEGGEPVRIVFLVLSPEDEPEAHLSLLGEIARLMSDKAVRDELVQVTNLPRMLQIIQDRNAKK
ncbi:MAG: cation:proton antiporter [Opitutales bacterium]|nr:cation:proton antiporter [Opitutales bacterium]